jgi:FkbM family methyltransferase
MGLNAKALVFGSIQSLFRTAGLQIGFDHPIRNAPKLFARKASKLGVKTVLDVGANKGQFVRELRKYGYSGEIVSFEPLSSAHAILCRKSENDAAWEIAPRMALGDANASAEINIAKNLASSSLLPVREASVSAAEESAFSGVETVPVRRLDDVLQPAWATPFALKLDTQGFELHVLRGCPNTLDRTALVVAEMSLAELYDGGVRLTELYRFLEDGGFRCISLVQAFADNARDELLQVDGIFVRNR